MPPQDCGPGYPYDSGVFMQVIFGKAADTDCLQRQWDHWRVDLASPAGWLGSAAGVTSDGRVSIVDRFSSAQGAEGNTRRPEHRSWWSTMERCFDGPVAVLGTEDVAVQQVRDATGAGFVQVMRARVRSRARFEAIEAQIGTAFAELRPDFLAGYRAWLDETTVVAVDYFSSEAEARSGEAKEMPDDLRAGFQEWLSLLEGTEWYDLDDPWLVEPD